MKFIAPSRSETKTSSQKSLTVKSTAWDQSRESHTSSHHNKSTCKHRWEGNESTFFLNPEQVLTLFGGICTQAGERGAHCLLVVVAMETGRDKRPGKWRKKMTSKDWKTKQNGVFFLLFSPFCYMNVLNAMIRAARNVGRKTGRWTKVKGLPSLLSLGSTA